jgi:PAS domain S-box-containing protein
MQEVELDAELRLKHFKTGALVPVLCNLYTIEDPVTEKPALIACVAQSIAVKNEMEERLRHSQREFSTLFHSSPVGIALVNMTGHPFDSNQRFQEILGYSADEVRQMQFAEFVHPDDLPSGRELFLDLALGKIEHYEVNKRLIDKQGNIIWTKMTVSLMRNRDGKPDYSISVVEPLSAPPVRRDDCQSPCAHA